MDRFQTQSGTIPNHPSHFAEGIRQLFGDDFDPDPLFLEESWTIGIPAAAENLSRRRQHTADRERQRLAFRDIDTLGSLFMIEDHDCAAETLLADRADRITREYASTCSQHSASARSSSEPPNGNHVRHRWNPGDWKTADGPRQSDLPQEPEPYVEPWNSMTVVQAHQLLGTSSASTRQQVRSAYRRMVSACHPDRLHQASESVRECATRQMATINEAYRLIRNNSMWVCA